jgi:hypothetical protein
MATLLRLPLSQRQAEALAQLLDEFGVAVGDTDTQKSLREVAEKLKTLREG